MNFFFFCSSFYLVGLLGAKAIFNKFTTGASKAIEIQNDSRYDATKFPK